MWGVCTRTVAKVRMMRPCGLVKSCHLVKPVSATLVAGRHLTQQEGLPSLSVPPLQQTCERYLIALEPIMEVDELKRAKQLVEEFQKPGGIGERLQRGLERKARNTENWSSDRLVGEYLKNRKPLVVHSNVGTFLPPTSQAVRDKWGQMRSAAKVIASVLDLKSMIDNDTLPVEYMRGMPLCMKPYHQMLSSCRIPGLEKDSLVYYAKSSSPPKHITVVHNSEIIVGEDGTCGINCVHTITDGTIQMALVDYFAAHMKKSEIMQSPMVPLPMPQKLHFNITPEIKKDIEETKHSMDILAQDLDLRVKVFDHFGKNVIKALKMSPDAFIQMAIQLAYYRMYQRCSSVFEAASLRMFRMGRTEGIRATSSASAAFVKAFDDPRKQNTEKVDLLEKAVKVHTSLSYMAVIGQGIDEHLEGLKTQAIEEKIPMPDFFTDISYTKAFDYDLSTSQVPSRNGCLPVTCVDKPNGYDLSYTFMNDRINFVATAIKSCKETNAAHLIQALEDTLLDMRTLLEQTPRV
ncbi:carnitine O-acetyltransferase-like isoform X2 [Thunnus maccoyii]|uniref:carnitine O-acetyltransferase-like isoform X2 n=1 Tax=Thunnus maccoyii TaxID=8240 RepID=UPI001C4CA098|nr:carnitine O-acetyltransferase-like isoform X2 [Thunnus maccoyii]